MGSGLILLLIVGAWLAVLVPMALRSSEAVSAQGTVDRFHDAMRVLSRRARHDSTAASPVPAPGPAPGPAPAQGADAPDGIRPPVRQPRAGRPGPTPAARRRRAVGVLVLVAVGSLVGGLLGPLWLLGVHVVADLLLLAGFLWLRHQAVLREERQWRSAMGDRRSRTSERWSPLEELAPTADRAPAAVLAPAVYGIPDRMPGRREIVSTDSVFDQDADVPARHRIAQHSTAQHSTAQHRAGRTAAPSAPQVPAARGAQGEPWQPVPVPVPMYVTAPRAPRRVVDLTVPSPEALAHAERSLGIDDQGPELEHILGRRAVGG